MIKYRVSTVLENPENEYALESPWKSLAGVFENPVLFGTEGP